MIKVGDKLFYSTLAQIQFFAQKRGKTPQNQPKLNQPRFSLNFQIKLKPTPNHQTKINAELNS